MAIVKYLGSAIRNWDDPGEIENESDERSCYLHDYLMNSSGKHLEKKIATLLSRQAMLINILADKKILNKDDLNNIAHGYETTAPEIKELIINDK
jgi:hypothetical protein